MKLTEIKLFPVRIRCTHPGEPRQPDLREHLIVKLETDEGLVGWGEMTQRGSRSATGPSAADLRDLLWSALAGTDPANVAAVHARLDGIHGLEARVRCGIDLAAHDLLGKQLGAPVHKLLGGALRAEIAVAHPIVAHRREEDIQASLDHVAKMLSEGYRLLRVYIGLNLDVDAIFLARLRREFGSAVAIKTLDLNGHVDWKTGREAAARFAEYGRLLVETPARRGDLEGLREVRRSTNTPVSEHAYTIADAAKLTEVPTVDVFNITLAGSGGISRALRIAAVAEAAGLACVLGGAHELAIGAAGLAHFGATLPHLAFPCDCIGTVIYADTIAPATDLYARGMLRVPSGPGLGVEIDEERLIALAPR